MFNSLKSSEYYSPINEKEMDDYYAYVLEGYIDNYTKHKNHQETFVVNGQPFDSSSKTFIDLSNNIGEYSKKLAESDKYQLIDENGFLIYKNDNNFKETLPKLKDSVLEDTNDILNYQKNMFIVSGLGALCLFGGVIATAIFINKSK